MNANLITCISIDQINSSNFGLSSKYINFARITSGVSMSLRLIKKR